MKRWHTNKTRPLSEERVIVVDTDNDVSIEWTDLDNKGRWFMSWGYRDCSWKEIKDKIKLWAYVDKYFEKELNK